MSDPELGAQTAAGGSTQHRINRVLRKAAKPLQFVFMAHSWRDSVANMSVVETRRLNGDSGRVPLAPGRDVEIVSQESAHA